MACSTRTRLRQQPGFACEECRRRKARCDRVRPKCGFCAESDMECIVVEKTQQRSPLKGQLNSMQSQLATLRWRLDQYLRPRPALFMSTQGPLLEPDPEPHAGLSVPVMLDSFNVQVNELIDQDISLAPTRYVGTSTTAALATPATSADSGIPAESKAASAALSGWPDWPDWQDINNTNSLISPITLSSTSEDYLDINNMNRNPATVADLSCKVNMPGLVRAELDQLYFERVHALCPIIHRRRYFALVDQKSHTPGQVCLQSAMRTLAAAMSAQWCHLSEQLYSETRGLLETQDQAQGTPRDKVPLQHIQAWLLLSHYELLRIDVRQAMLTAGRAFRYVQMARLSEIDSPYGDLRISPVASSSPSSSSFTWVGSSESFVDAEERRRTFWLAFTIDRLLCLQNDWPLTLQEEMIFPRLPAPEANFQNSQQDIISFPAEALEQRGPSTLSPFAECIVMATLHGRCMTHRRSYINESETKMRDFCIRQGWLATAVERRVQMLEPSLAVDSDPMLLFTHMLAYRATIDLSNTVQRALWCTGHHQDLVAAYQNRAAQAASEIVRLAKAVPCLSPFKAHPFLPDILACAATFLTAQAGPQSGDCDSVRYLLQVLAELQDTHSLARDYLQNLKIQYVGTNTAEDRRN